MKRLLRLVTTIFSALILILVCFINTRLYYSPEIKVIEGDTINYDALCQLRSLRDAMENNAAIEMQDIYPEGYVFFNVLYGLSWYDLAERLNRNSNLCHEAHVEIQHAFNNVNSNLARIVFDSTLALPYGAFYNGWTTYLLGRKLSIEPPEQRDPKEVSLFKVQCDRIAKAISKQTYPETYRGNSWPADGVMCVAALAQYDKLFTPVYQQPIKVWVIEVNQNLDPTGLIPHSSHPDSGKPLEAARGSSQSLMLCFIPEIDNGLPGFGSYLLKFFDHRFGLPGIREYPEGVEGNGDIDSGPVILGIGGAATIVGVRTMRINNFTNESVALLNSIEALALPFKMKGRKKYLMGKLPIADVFITWAQGADHVDHSREDLDFEWRKRFQVWSSVIGVAIIAGLVLMWKSVF